MARAAVAMLLLVALGVSAHAGNVPQPLTDRHYLDAPSTVIERDTGIPAPLIEQWQRRERERDPYPSIPGDPGESDVRILDDVHRRPVPRN